MSKFSTVWVFSDDASRLPEMMGGALALGESIQAVTVSDAQSTQAFRSVPVLPTSWEQFQAIALLRTTRIR